MSRRTRYGCHSRWLIVKRGSTWYVTPPVGSFWGSTKQFRTGVEALAHFRRTTKFAKYDNTSRDRSPT